MRGYRFREFLILSASVAALTTSAVAQSPAGDANKGSSKKSSARVVTLNGCVSGGAGHYVLSDAQGRATYRLNGAGVSDYLGRHVRISGVQPRRLRIAGGLYPSPNVAAQAGAIDPTKAAEAASVASMAARVPEIDVKSVQLVPGACEQR